MARSMDDFVTVEKEADLHATRKLRIGIIGTGGIAKAHLQSYLKQPDVEIVAGADLIPGKAKRFFEQYGLTNVKTDYASHREMLDDKSLKLDAVSVCTYNSQHAAPTIYALEKGINVLLEKPFTVTLDEAIEVMRAEKKSGKILSVGFQPRFDDNMKMVREIVQSGKLGKVYYIQTGGGRRRGIPVPRGTSFIEKDTAGIGALGDIGCYSLDMVLNAIGYPKPLTVSGYTSSYFGKNPDYSVFRKIGHPEYAAKFGVDDFAAAFIRLEGGVILDFRIAWAMNIDSPCDTVILGTEGGLRIPATECWNGASFGEMTLYQEVCGEQTEMKIPLINNETSGFENLFALKIRSFLDAIQNGTEAPVPTSQILYNQAIIDGIQRSAESGEEIRIRIPDLDDGQVEKG